MTEKEMPQQRVTWEPLSPYFLLPIEHQDNLEHSLLASGLKEVFHVAGLLTPSILIASNLAICATVDGQTIVVSPDWVYIPFVKSIPEEEIPLSYTPHLEGEVPSIIIEFLSNIDRGEYDREPGGRWWFYEKILKVPKYAIFEPNSGRLEVYTLNSGSYEEEIMDKSGFYWIPEVNLFLGVAYDTYREQMGHWLRWWDLEGNVLLWWQEKIARDWEQVERIKQQVDAIGRISDPKKRVAEVRKFAAEAQRRATEAIKRSNS